MKKRQPRWKHWLADLPPFQISNDAKFSDILVPTIDNIRNAHIIEMLLRMDRPVLCVGPTGTSKTLTVADKLTRSMPKEFSPEFIVFSAKTNANQTQDLIDSKLDKRFVDQRVLFESFHTFFFVFEDVVVFTAHHWAKYFCSLSMI